MVAVWMLYATVVGLLVMSAAAALEQTQRERGAARWVWTMSFLVALGLPFLRTSVIEALVWIATVIGTPVGPASLVQLGTIEVISAPQMADALAPWDVRLLLAWTLLTFVLGGSLGLGIVKTRRAMFRWTRQRVDDMPVLMSGDVGPAVVGIRSPQIVLPAWALSLPESDRRLILQHEDEHRRARDPALLTAGLLAAILMPWNAALWWGFARLRHAVETDCDRRVLTSGRESVQGYARLLLEVGTRPSARIPLGAGFGERPSTLEKRIRAVLASPSRGVRRTAGRVVLAGLLFTGSCSLNSPDAVSPTDIQMSQVPADLSAEPTFTPFTEAPSISNREEVIAAMSAEYPPLLREAGIGGTVRVYFFIDERGEAQDIRIDKTSGHPAIDDAAIRVASVYDFTAAKLRGEPVPVWVSFPITFQVR